MSTVSGPEGTSPAPGRRPARLLSPAAGLALLVVPPLDMLLPSPADAGTYKALRAQCFLPDVAPEAKIHGCSAVIDAGREPKPTLARAHFHRGNAFAQQREYRRAIVDYDAALLLSPRNAEALFQRGMAKLRSEDMAGGNADIAAARQIDPAIGGVRR